MELVYLWSNWSSIAMTFVVLSLTCLLWIYLRRNVRNKSVRHWALLDPTPANDRVGIKDMREILNALKKHHFPASRYHDLGLQLGLFHSPTLTDISNANGNNEPDKCLDKCLVKWLMQVDNSCPPTWNSLIFALESIGLKAVASGIDRERHQACAIFDDNESHIKKLLDEPIIRKFVKREIVKDETAQDVDLLQMMKKSVCACHEGLRKFAVFLKKLQKPEGRILLREYKRHYPWRQEVNAGPKIHVRDCSEFTDIKAKFTNLFYDASSAIMEGAIPLEFLQRYLKLFYGEPELHCQDTEHALHLIRKNCSLIDIKLLEAVVNKFNVSSLRPAIQEYERNMKEFCENVALRRCLDENFSESSLLLCETITFIIDGDVDDYTVSDVKCIISRIFSNVAPHVKLTVVRETESFVIICSFQLIHSYLLISTAFENIAKTDMKDVLQIKIGYCIVYDASNINKDEEISIYTCKGVLEQLVISMSAHQNLSTFGCLTENDEKSIDMMLEIKELREEVQINKKLKRGFLHEIDILKFAKGDTDLPDHELNEKRDEQGALEQSMKAHQNLSASGCLTENDEKSIEMMLEIKELREKLQTNEKLMQEYIHEIETLKSTKDDSNLPNQDLKKKRDEQAEKKDIKIELLRDGIKLLQKKLSAKEPANEERSGKKIQLMLSITHLTEMYNLLQTHSVSAEINYQKLGLRLGVSSDTLQIISQKSHDDDDRCLKGCLKAWLEQVDNVRMNGSPTIYSLIHALRSIGNCAIADEIDKEKHPACAIFNEYASNETIVEAIPSFIVTLQNEKIITKIPANGAEVAQVKESICADHSILEKLASILQRFERTKEVATKMKNDYLKHFGSQPTCGIEIIKISIALSDLQTVRAEYAKIMASCRKAMSTIKLHELKTYLRNGYGLQLDDSKTEDHALDFICDKCSLVSVAPLKSLAQNFSIHEAISLIQQYDEVVTKFCEDKLLGPNKEHCGASHMQSKVVVVPVDKSIDRRSLDDTRMLASHAFSDKVQVLVIERDTY